MECELGPGRMTRGQEVASNPGRLHAMSQTDWALVPAAVPQVTSIQARTTQGMGRSWSLLPPSTWFRMAQLIFNLIKRNLQKKESSRKIAHLGAQSDIYNLALCPAGIQVGQELSPGGEESGSRGV